MAAAAQRSRATRLRGGLPVGQHDGVVHALPTDRADEALRVLLVLYMRMHEPRSEVGMVSVATVHVLWVNVDQCGSM